MKKLIAIIIAAIAITYAINGIGYDKQTNEIHKLGVIDDACSQIQEEIYSRDSDGIDYSNTDIQEVTDDCSVQVKEETDEYGRLVSLRFETLTECDLCGDLVEEVFQYGAGWYCDACLDGMPTIDYCDIIVNGFDSPCWCDSCGEVYEEDELLFNMNVGGWCCDGCNEYHG